MHVEYHRWWSSHLNREMELKVYGHWGMPYLVFPSSRGRFFDYEGMGMIDAGMGRLLGIRCQPRLAVVVPADELFSQ